MKFFIKIILLPLFLLLPLLAMAKQIPPVPDPPRLVNDFTGTLSSNEVAALEQKLVAYDDSTSTQIAIVIENSLEGDDIFDYSYRLAEGWGIGRQGKNNGILIYIALGDRKLRIQTGYGAEGFLPDALARRIIEQVIAPNFKSQNYYAGLDEATDVIMKLGSGEYTNDDVGQQSGGLPVAIILFLVIFIIVIIIIISSKGGGGGGGYSKGGKYDAGGGWILFGPGSNWGGGKSGGDWGGGGFGGGGFGGFGGGGFGGGGAGGSW